GYDAEERDEAGAAFCRNPHGTGLSGRSALSLGLQRGSRHLLRLASRSSSRKAAVATVRDLFRGSLVRDAILVLNAGSSSLKFSVFGSGADLAPLVAGNLEELQGRAR